MPREAIEVAESAAAANLTFVYAFGWLRDGRPDLYSSQDPATNSWRNEDTRADFVSMVTEFAELARPQDIFVRRELLPAWIEPGSDEWKLFQWVVDAVRLAVAPYGATTVMSWPEILPAFSLPDADSGR